MLSFLTRLLFPPKCHFCRRILNDNETDLCHSCRTNAPEFIRAKRSLHLIAHWTAVWYYKDDVRNSIRRFKFYNARGYADFFGRAIAMQIRESSFPDNFDVLTWVPVSPLRRLTRGYDQSELLAQALGKELGMTPVPGIKKFRHTRPQSGIRNGAERRANVFNAYRGMNQASFAGKRVLLVDDVITTGATASECAKTLLVSGATHVYLATIAATPNHKSRR